jgi:phosphoenolpyruvate carboxykinase (ATP)
VIALNFDEKLILIGNTAYAGENKKSVFTVLNYLLPGKGVMPMHCSANHAIGNPARPPCSSACRAPARPRCRPTPDRTLIGDDEHGWSDRGVFNFEGGCYAKTINLSAEAEPEIYATTHRFGTVVENMVYDPDTWNWISTTARLTENTRCAYPLDFIPNASPPARRPSEEHVIMLTCDAFGVLPPIARLTPAQAMYHFLSGFTAKVAGTERGVTEPKPTFSTCFGAPFMPRRPEVYGKLLQGKDRQATARPAGWSTPAGPAGPMAPASSGCRSRRPARLAAI